MPAFARRWVARAAVLLAGMMLAVAAAAQQNSPLVTLNQGPEWTRSHAAEFYETDQGSRIMPLAWMAALTLPDGTGFLDDGLARYNYIGNYIGNPRSAAGLPIGFMVAPFAGRPTVAMNCAACHTRELEVAGTRYRVDGGPAMADFQSFLADLETASAAALASDAAFAAFAQRAGPDEDPAALRTAVEDWFRPFSAIVTGSLPDPAWGPGRLDAISMIFNRIAGLDIGEGEDRLIRENIVVADAPTRYPFLWNAARQDLTQWPGFAENGNEFLGLARNLGQVYGVFGAFHPVATDDWLGLDIDYVKHNSANFSGLSRLEELVWSLGPPRWPWPVDQPLADAGEAIFNLSEGEGGCVECHGKRRGAFRFPNWNTWDTPLDDAGTDTRECKVLARVVKTGVLEGAKIPLVGDPLGETAPAIDVLRTAVIGAIIQDKLSFGTAEPAARSAAAAASPERQRLDRELERLIDGEARPDYAARAAPSAGLAMSSDEDLLRQLETLRGYGAANRAPGLAASSSAATAGCEYEARVLDGIWATAPYLHNGAVPSLDELLKPSTERVASFRLGPRYDIVTVGLAAEQSVFDFTLETTGCDDRGSGRSRCGHDYGTGLSAEERRALLEYLKTL